MITLMLNPQIKGFMRMFSQILTFPTSTIFLGAYGNLYDV